MCPDIVGSRRFNTASAKSLDQRLMYVSCGRGSSDLVVPPVKTVISPLFKTGMCIEPFVP